MLNLSNLPTGTRIQAAEQVRMGHPDRLADMIADGLLLFCVNNYPYDLSFLRCAFEVMLNGDNVFVCGETNFPNLEIRDIKSVVGSVLGKYTPLTPFPKVNVSIQNQSSQLRKASALGAGDQGIVYGYCDSVFHHQSMAFNIANYACELLDIHSNIEYLMPDGKVQVYFLNGVDAHLIVSAQQSEEARTNVRKWAFEEQVSHYLSTMIEKKFSINVKTVHLSNNPQFIKGGAAADTGLTGRKIHCDAYGSGNYHGGGAFAGKDLTKVDRSGAYYAALLANAICRNTGEKTAIQLTYCLGEKNPISCAYKLGDDSRGFVLFDDSDDILAVDDLVDNLSSVVYNEKFLFPDYRYSHIDLLVSGFPEGAFV